MSVKRKIKSTSKKILPTVIVVIVSVLLSVFTCSLVARNTTAFEDDGMPIGVNKENLVHTIDEYTTKAGNTGKGIVWKVNSTGSIVADGTYSINETTNMEFVLGTVTVEKEDYYTLTGAASGSLGTFYIEARYTDTAGNAKVLYSDFNGQMTSSDVIAVGTEITIKIIVKSGVEFNNYTFKPTLVPGESAGRF